MLIMTAFDDFLLIGINTIHFNLLLPFWLSTRKLVGSNTIRHTLHSSISLALHLYRSRFSICFGLVIGLRQVLFVGSRSSFQVLASMIPSNIVLMKCYATKCGISNLLFFLYALPKISIFSYSSKDIFF